MMEVGSYFVSQPCKFYCKVSLTIFIFLQRDRLWPEEEAEVVGGGGGLDPQLVLQLSPSFSAVFLIVIFILIQLRVLISLAALQSTSAFHFREWIRIR